jgi:mannose-1-phosphate guanylyltransferase/mannose-6-phosphate isomerase
VISIILAGGEGRRLWPLSTADNPKQFINFAHIKGSLFQEAYKRALQLSEPNDIHVVTNEKYVARTMKELDGIDVHCMESNIIGEPFARNTLPAILAGIWHANTMDEDIVAVFPADHYISNSVLFVKSLKESIALAENSIVTFGINPLYPETGYGYTEPGRELENGFMVKSFREKPDKTLAAAYIEKGYLWNSGIFMFRAGLIMDEARRFAPGVYNAFSEGGSIPEIFNRISTGISIDVGLLEKSEKIAVVPINIGWDDLGSFAALFRIFPKISYKTGNNDVFHEIDENFSLITSADGNIYLSHGDAAVLLRSG